MAQRPFSVLQPFGQPGTAGDLNGLVLSNYTLPVKRITTPTYTILPEDSGWILNYNTAAGTAVVVPILPEGFSCLHYQKNSGNVTFNFSANVTNVTNVTGLTGPGSYTSLAVVDNQFGTSCDVLLSAPTSALPPDSTGQAPVNVTPPSISGTPTQGFTLVANPGAWSNNPTGFTYQWTANGNNIAGATSTTFIPGSGQVNATIRVVVTASNATGSTPVASASVGPVAGSATAPVNTSLPLVSGTTTEGQTLTVSNGTWTNSPTSYTYQWLRDGVAISGANGASFLLTSADISAAMSCTVTAFNGSETGQATSAETADVAAVGGGGTGYEAEASTLFSAMTSQPTDARKGLINALILSLKTGATSSSNIFAKLDYLQIYAAHDSQAAALNWIAPGTGAASAINSPTFTTDRGYAGNGKSSYLITGLTTSTATQGTLNTNSMSVWSRTNSNNATAVSAGATTAGASGHFIRPRNSSNTMQAKVSDATTSAMVTSTVTTSIGLFTVMRTDANTKIAYINSAAGSGVTVAATALATVPVTVGCVNSNGTPGSYDTREIAVFAYGANRSAAEELDFYNAIRTYLVAVGAAT